MLRPTSLCSLVVAVSAVAVASGTSVWQPGDGQAILAHAAGLHLMDGHLARWFSTVGDRIQHDSTPKPTSTTNQGRQATPNAPVDLVFRYMNGDAGGYATTFYIGTPPQPVTFGLDLTSADVMVLNHKIDGHRYYDHSKSSTYKPNGTHFNYGEYLRGYMSGDDISLGDPDKHAIKLPDQLFLELTGKDELLSTLPTDGSLGFGIRDSVFLPGTPPPIRTLIDKGQLEEPVIGLYVAEHDAHAMIGGIDSMYTQGPVTYFPVDQTDLRWSVLFDSIAVGGKTVAGAHGRALMYTAVAAIVGPKAQVEAIAEAVGVHEGWIPCNATTPNVTIQVTKDIKVTLTKEDYSVPTKSDNVCMFTILSSPMFHGWGFGAPFLRKVYTVLDFGKSNADARTGIAALHGIGPQE